MTRIPPDTALLVIDVQRAIDDPKWVRVIIQAPSKT
jgi:hypothetical protein